MSPETLQAMCESKHRYPDKKSARTFLNFARRMRGRRGRALELRAYDCPVCKGWHVTKQV